MRALSRSCNGYSRKLKKEMLRMSGCRESWTRRNMMMSRSRSYVTKSKILKPICGKRNASSTRRMTRSKHWRPSRVNAPIPRKTYYENCSQQNHKWLSCEMIWNVQPRKLKRRRSNAKMLSTRKFMLKKT